MVEGTLSRRGIVRLFDHPFVQSILEGVIHLFWLVWESFVEVLAYPLNARERLFWLYVLTSVGFALAAVAWSRRNDKGDRRGLWAAAFPAEVWKHPSTWVDLRYFFPHQMVRIWVYSGLTVLVVFGVSTGMVAVAESWMGPVAVRSEPVHWLWIGGYTVALMAVLDFGMYVVHFLQHRVPVLWAFHKVHHSATVLNPFSNYREHPVDNVFYAVVYGGITGLFAGGMMLGFGWKVSLWTVLGISAPSFLFNILGYHLRHSHVWLRWPGILGMVFGCPAHHQIHHSFRPEHIDKNMAFMFPIWDVLFGTYRHASPSSETTLEVGVSPQTPTGFLQQLAEPFVRSMSTDRAEHS